MSFRNPFKNEPTSIEEYDEKLPMSEAVNCSRCEKLCDSQLYAVILERTKLSATWHFCSMKCLRIASRRRQPTGGLSSEVAERLARPL